MRHRQARNRLRYKPTHTRSLKRNLVTSVLLYESIRTTKKRAEVIRPIVEHIITVAKTRSAHVAIRYINQIVTHKNACRKTMEVLKERFKSRSSGYTRMVPLGSRSGDGAKLVNLSLLEGEEVVKPAPAPKKAPAKKKAQSASSKSAS